MDAFNDHRAASILTAGQAITLRAKAISVLRIAHGRVWVTVTEVGPYSRVMAGDHFLSRGDSLTLLPGQELVMEPFGRGCRRHASSGYAQLARWCAAAADGFAPRQRLGGSGHGAAGSGLGTRDRRGSGAGCKLRRYDFRSWLRR